MSASSPDIQNPADRIPGLRRLLVAGTAGGVGTTTVAALLFAELREVGDAPFLIDHTGGDLGPRIPGGDEVPAVDHRFRLHDLGRNVGAAVAELHDPGVSLIMVTAATGLGRTLAAERLRLISQRRPAGDEPSQISGSQISGSQSSPSQIVAVQVECFGRRARRPVPEDAGTPIRGQALVPVDDVLAAGGRIPYNRPARPTRQAVRRLTGLVRPDLVR